MNNNYFLESNFHKIMCKLYDDFGFKQTNKIQLELTENVNYFASNNWIGSHEFRPHDSFKYFFRFELFTKDMNSYDEYRDYIWYYEEYKRGEDNKKISSQILEIREKVLLLLKSKFPEKYRDIQLENLLK